MTTENFEQWFKINKLSETSDIVKRISEENMDLMEENLARVSNQMKRLANVKNVEDLINLQKDCWSENISAGAQNLQRLFQMGIETQEEILKKWGAAASKTVEKSVEKAHKFAEKAEK